MRHLVWHPLFSHSRLVWHLRKWFFLFIFCTSLTFNSTCVGSYGNLAASLTMFDAALKGVLHSPTSFFDTTPMGKRLSSNYASDWQTTSWGRIFSRFSKDQDTIDAQLSTTLDQVSSNVCFAHYCTHWSLVLDAVQLCCRNGEPFVPLKFGMHSRSTLGCSCVLRLSVPRNYIRPPYCPILDSLNVLQKKFCGNEATRFFNAFNIVWFYCRFDVLLPGPLLDIDDSIWWQRPLLDWLRFGLIEYRWTSNQSYWLLITKYPLATIYQQRRPWPGPGEPCLLHDHCHSALARRPPGFLRKHSHLRDCAICCWV